MTSMILYYVEIVYINGSVEKLATHSWGFTKEEAKRLAEKHNSKSDVALARVITERVMA